MNCAFFGRSSVQRLNQLKYTQAAWATDIKPLPKKDKKIPSFLAQKHDTFAQKVK